MKYKRITADKINNEGVIHLLEQFVKEIRDDYISAYVSMMDNYLDPKAHDSYKKMKELVCSEHFYLLTGLNGKDLIKGLDDECSRIYKEGILNGKILEDQ